MLCFVLVARKVLITHQYFGYCWAVLAQHQGCLSNFPSSPVSWGWARSWEVTQPEELTQTDQTAYSIPYDIWSAINSKRKERKRGRSLFMTFVFRSNHYVYWSPASWEVAGHHLPMGSRKQIIYFSLRAAFTFALLNCIYLDPWAFSPLPILLRRAVIRDA